MKLYYSQFELAFGSVFLMGTDAGLFQLVLNEHELPLNFPTWSDKFACEFVHDQGKFQDIVTDLAGYFAGLPMDFDYRLDLRGASAFERAVWDKARHIPYGQAKSYKWLANQVHHPNAFKAVGRALSMNPLPIVIPCHRVIMHDASLGGFASGVGWKDRLLRLERGELLML
jgi:methylated-DNA-[protein]-cysteine S-methyltransferase